MKIRDFLNFMKIDKAKQHIFGLPVNLGKMYLLRNFGMEPHTLRERGPGGRGTALSL